MVAASSADAAFFDLRGTQGSEVDDAAVGLTTVDTITATLTASSGTLNQTTSAFGVNATGTGDDTDELDSDLGTESITITFDKPVTFDSFSVSSFGSGELGEYSVNGGTFVEINATDTYAVGQNLAIGETFVIRHKAGIGFSFDDFTVTEIPEPASLALTGLAGLALLARRRRRA